MGYQKLTPIIATGGSTPRYLGDRFADIVNLKDFGAKGDGETDDSTAWAAWRTALQNGGMPYIPAGSYLLGDELFHVPNGRLDCNEPDVLFGDESIVWRNRSNPIYLDAENGDDDNSGMFEGDAVQTFAKVKQILKTQNTENVFEIHIAGGTYDDNIDLRGITCVFYINGNVKFTDGCYLRFNAKLLVLHEEQSFGTYPFYGDTEYNNTLTIESNTGSSISLRVDSAFYSTVPLSCKTNLSSGNENHCIYVESGSFLRCVSSLSLNCTNCSNCIYVVESSYFEVNGVLSIAGSSNNSGIQVRKNSYGLFSGGINASNCISGMGIGVSENSRIETFGDVAIYAKNCVYASFGSSLEMMNYDSISLNKNTSDGYIISASYCSVIKTNKNNGVDSYITINAGNDGGGRCINSTDHSNVELACAKITWSGTVSTTVYASVCSSVYVYNSTTFSGSLTGKRYDAKTGGFIITGGGGANRFPGSTAGSVDSYGSYYI